MSTLSSMPHVPPLSRRKMAELKARARSLGMTPQDYVLRLIEADLALDRRAKDTPLAELAAPFAKALHGESDSEIDRIVRSVRSRNIRGPRR